MNDAGVVILVLLGAHILIMATIDWSVARAKAERERVSPENKISD